jgi:hypothetical protein
MPFKNPDFISNTPYNDDFLETKNFLKILFKPGYAVQARELTQLQTILQSQIAKFADHIFEDGSQIFGGNIKILDSPYVRVENVTHNTIGATTNDSDAFLENLSSNILKVYVKTGSTFNELCSIGLTHSEPSGFSSNDNYSILFYNVISVSPAVTNGTFEMRRGYYIGTNSSGPFLRVINPNFASTAPDQYTINPFGEGKLVTVDDGIFYVDGYFVTSTKQTISLYKSSKEDESEKTLNEGLEYTFAEQGIRLFSVPSHRIGYEISREVVSVTEDTTLRDPAKGYYNFNAPGADRYKISLTLKPIEYDVLSVDIDNFVSENFIQLLRTTRGVVDYIKDKTTYSQILDLFAKRTQDESGSYTVKPFIADVKNHLRKDKYIFEVSANSINEYFDAFNNINITSNSYIWQVSGGDINPFALSSLDDATAAVGKIVDIIPNYNVTLTNPQKTLKLVVELLNNKRFNFGVDIDYYLRKNSASSNQIVKINTIIKEIDSQGAYSTIDIPVGNPNKLAITLQPGKAYIYGYEYETFAPRTIEYLNNGNQTEVKISTGLNVNFELGNYVYGSFSSKSETSPAGNIDFETLPELELVDHNLNTFLLYPTISSQVKARILSWNPFKALSDSEVIGNQVDLPILYGVNTEAVLYPHESVIFVAEKET